MLLVVVTVTAGGNVDGHVCKVGRWEPGGWCSLVVMVCGLEVVVLEVEAKAGGGGGGWWRMVPSHGDWGGKGARW